MSGSRAPHLQRRNGIYHLRVRVPDHVRPRLGQNEVHRSLGTYACSRARILAATYAARVMGAFKMIAENDLSTERARQLVRSCFADLIKETENYGAFVPVTSEPDLETDEQRHFSKLRIADLQQRRGDRQYGGDVETLTEQLLGSSGISLAAISPTRRIDLLDGIARALIEQQRMFLQRLDDRLMPFIPSDDLFRDYASHHKSFSAVPVECKPDAVKGVTVGEGISKYLKHGTSAWVSKTLAARKWQLRYLQEHLGEHALLGAVTAHDIRAFRDAILTLRKNHGRSPTQTFLEKQTENTAHRVAFKTASLIFEPCKAFFRWAKSVEGLIDSNPAEDVRLVVGKVSKSKNEKARRPFREPELRQLFSSPLWTGCHSFTRRYKPGNKVFRDAKFWIPILGFYSGARLGELVQLHMGDVCLDGAIPFISINEENDAAAEGVKKHVKSIAGVRRVPLHPDIMELGFAKFVLLRQKGKKITDRLFPEFPYGSDGQASTVFSKFFARLLDAVGLTDPALVYHSFRHGAQDAFRDALTPQYVTDRIIGHYDGATSSGYGEGVSLEVMYEAIKSMKLKARLTDYLLAK